MNIPISNLSNRKKPHRNRSIRRSYDDRHVKLVAASALNIVQVVEPIWYQRICQLHILFRYQRFLPLFALTSNTFYCNLLGFLSNHSVFLHEITSNPLAYLPSDESVVVHGLLKGLPRHVSVQVHCLRPALFNKWDTMLAQTR